MGLAENQSLFRVENVSHRICSAIFLMKNHFFKFISSIVVIGLQSFTLSAFAGVWENQSSWSQQKESEFQDWVLTRWNKNFFAVKTDSDGTPNPYYGILNDCADTVYTMRLIFAFENKLPFEINDPTGGRLHISNSMSRWNNEPNEYKRLRKFITYIHDVVSTLSLPNDSYPVAISAETIVPGSILMTGKKNHHSWTVKQMLSIGVPHLIFNSVVRSKSSPVLQERKTWPNPFWVFEGMGSDMSRAGFRYWKPVEYLDTPGIRIPEASLEQFRIPLKNWVKTIQAKIATEEESAEGGMKRVIEALCDGLTKRVSDVEETVMFKRASSQSCMSAEDFDNYSTPSRDHRIFDDFITLRDLYIDALKNQDPLSESLRSKIAKIYPNTNLSPLVEAQNSLPLPMDAHSLCSIAYSAKSTIDLAEAKRRMFIGKLSSDPNQSLGRRWGENNPPAERGDNCKSEPIWKPFH